MVLFSTILKYLLSDLPVIITGFYCMYLITKIYLKEENVRRRWITLVLIEGFEHLIIPIALFFIILLSSSFITAILFNTTLLLFLFGFIGKIIIKAKTKKDWLNILKITGFTYFFVFFYPPIVISTQVYTPLNGWWILALTSLIFTGFYFYKSWSSSQH